MNGTLIYLAVTRGRNRLVISGSFELYGEFMRSSLPAMRTDAGNLPVSTLSSESMPRSKKWQGLWKNLLGKPREID